ncbi:MAG TPA: type II toxin-antitoxin system prevent-host-death family antitoxin [Candidatus Deferrimicrobiaceae bacterium]
MITVGVRELKARLSSYIGIARRGEEVVVTTRGREVAILVPVTKERMALKRLSEGGEVRMPRGKPKGARGVKVKGKPVADTVLGDRR